MILLFADFSQSKFANLAVNYFEWLEIIHSKERRRKYQKIV